MKVWQASFVIMALLLAGAIVGHTVGEAQARDATTQGTYDAVCGECENWSADYCDKDLVIRRARYDYDRPAQMLTSVKKMKLRCIENDWVKFSGEITR